MVLIWLPFILNLSNLSCISFNIFSVGVASLIFYFVISIGRKGVSLDEVASLIFGSIGDDFEELATFFPFGGVQSKIYYFCCLVI